MPHPAPRRGVASPRDRRRGPSTPIAVESGLSTADDGRPRAPIASTDASRAASRRRRRLPLAVRSGRRRAHAARPAPRSPAPRASAVRSPPRRITGSVGPARAASPRRRPHGAAHGVRSSDARPREPGRRDAPVRPPHGGSEQARGPAKPGRGERHPRRWPEGPHRPACHGPCRHHRARRLCRSFRNGAPCGMKPRPCMSLKSRRDQ